MKKTILVLSLILLTNFVNSQSLKINYNFKLAIDTSIVKHAIYIGFTYNVNMQTKHVDIVCGYYLNSNLTNKVNITDLKTDRILPVNVDLFYKNYDFLLQEIADKIKEDLLYYNKEYFNYNSIIINL